MFGSGQCLMFETWGLKRVVSNLEAVSRSQPCNPVYDECEEEIMIKNAKERKGSNARKSNELCSIVDKRNAREEIEEASG
jgi:hypothetical protein